MEPLSTILPFSVDDSLPYLSNFYRNGSLGLGRRYGEKIRFLLKLIICTFKCISLGTSIINLTFSVNDPLPDLPNFPGN